MSLGLSTSPLSRLETRMNKFVYNSAALQGKLLKCCLESVLRYRSIIMKVK
jgi:hypothetical protein